MVRDVQSGCPFNIILFIRPFCHWCIFANWQTRCDAFFIFLLFRTTNRFLCNNIGCCGILCYGILYTWHMCERIDKSLTKAITRLYRNSIPKSNKMQLTCIGAAAHRAKRFKFQFYLHGFSRITSYRLSQFEFDQLVFDVWL